MDACRYLAALLVGAIQRRSKDEILADHFEPVAGLWAEASLTARIAEIAAGRATPAQVVFRFAQQIGMLPLTGTSSPEHMKEDLESDAFDLTAAEVDAIESLVG